MMLTRGNTRLDLILGVMLVGDTRGSKVNSGFRF